MPRKPSPAAHRKSAYLKAQRRLRRNPIGARIEAAITRTRGVQGGLPCLAGTRIHIERCIVDPFMSGSPIKEIHNAYSPWFTVEQIEDALRWWYYFGDCWRAAAVRKRGGKR